MHKHEWTDFNDEISFIPADFPEGNIRIYIDSDAGEAWMNQEEFNSFVSQIREKMGW